jgi:hypothetical protein
MEYVIEKNSTWAIVPAGKLIEISWTKAHNFASVFKNKERAQQVVKYFGGTVESYYGTFVQGTKRIVSPKQSQVNKSAPYRSI